MAKATNKDVINFVRNNSYLQKQCSDENDLQFSTRKNGTYGRCGNADISEANKIMHKLVDAFENVTVEIGGSDEWVSVMVEII